MHSEEKLKAELKKAVAECDRLREENTRLQLRLNERQVTVPLKSKHFTANNNKAQASGSVTVDSTPEAKVSLFRSLFRGRDDVYPVRWEGRSEKAGYSPAGVREWDHAASPNIGKKRSFHYSKLFPLSEEVIRDHLLGKHTIGVYPLLQDDTCWFVAVDFDKKNWQVDALAFLKTCNQTGVPAALERSRSGIGGHVWIFFASPIQAALARKLASAVLTRTMERHYAMGLDSYDRLFPSQDTMPKGGSETSSHYPYNTGLAKTPTASSLMTGFAHTKISGRSFPRSNDWARTRFKQFSAGYIQSAT